MTLSKEQQPIDGLRRYLSSRSHSRVLTLPTGLELLRQRRERMVREATDLIVAYDTAIQRNQFGEMPGLLPAELLLLEIEALDTLLTGANP